MIEVMEHFDKGGEVEFSTICDNVWKTLSFPSWNWAEFDYKKKEISTLVSSRWLVVGGWKCD